MRKASTDRLRQVALHEAAHLFIANQLGIGVGEAVVRPMGHSYVTMIGSWPSALKEAVCASAGIACDWITTGHRIIPKPVGNNDSGRIDSFLGQHFWQKHGIEGTNRDIGTLIASTKAKILSRMERILRKHWNTVTYLADQLIFLRNKQGIISKMKVQHLTSYIQR